MSTVSWKMAPLLGGPVAGGLGLLVLRLHGVVRQLALLAALEHVVGPLRAAAALTVHEAATTCREGAPPPAPALHPGLFSVTIVVLEEEEEEVRKITGLKS